MPDPSSPSSGRRRTLLFMVGLILGLLALSFFRCGRTVVKDDVTAAPPSESESASVAPAEVAAGEKQPDEVLTPATLQAPEKVSAGAVFSVQWTGPNNAGDYVTIVRKEAADDKYDHYRNTREGSTLELTAPMEPGEHEVRYVAVRSHTVLGRAPIVVAPIEASLTGPAEAVLGTTIAVEWTGPNNAGDYVTVVAKDTPDGKYGNYTYTTKGSPLSLTLPPEAGEAELRYMSGQGAKVLARRPITILAPDVSLSAAEEAIAGSMLTVNWTGPANRGDYITLLPKAKPDGQYGNYTDVSKGSPLTVLVPIEPGEAELRYMTAQGAKVLGRRAINIVAAEITLDAPAEAVAGSAVSIAWTGPNHGGDYLTLVPKTKPDGQYGNYTETRRGSPLTITAPKEPGDAEIRYMSGQGAKVLARRAIKIVAP